MGEQEYSSNVLAEKRLMTNFVPTTGSVRHKREERGLLNMACLERRDEFRATC